MRRGLLLLLAIASAVSVAAAFPAARSGSRDPDIRDCFLARWWRPLAWSENGRWVAFNRPVGQKAFALTVADVRMGRSRTVRVSDQGFGVSWSPVGATLLGFTDHEIYVGPPEGRLRLIARGCFGAWSPKGRRIAFAADGWVVTSDPNGRAKKRIIRGDGVESWSADGRRLAVVRFAPVECRPFATEQMRLSVYRFDRRALRRLTGDRRPFGGVPGYRGDQWQSSFAPDGRWLAYGEESGCAGGRAVFDQGPEAFLAGRPDRPIGFGFPVWSPSGDLLFLRPMYWWTGSVVTRDGAALMYIGGDGSWSPDSTRIAYSWDSNLYVANVHGARPDAVPPRKQIARGHLPAWSPDGSAIAFIRTTSSPFPCRYELHLVPAEGGEPRRLVGC